MLARVFSATMVGLHATKIQVEVDLNQGKPLFVIIGLASKTVEEAKERITTALRNCDIRIRSKRTIVNLAPADLKKNTSVLELAIAVALLKAYEEVTFSTNKTIFFGELSLDGSIRKINGALPLVLAAKNLGMDRVIIPQANIQEVKHISGITIHPIRHLNQVIKAENTLTKLPRLNPQPFTPKRKTIFQKEFISGQLQAQRALEIAAAGHHHLLITGPPGSGKTLLAKSIQQLLPPLTEAEATQISSIYSVCGLLKDELITHRPFRSPHHSSSTVSLLGGTHALKPGEISLAHLGVLFLDEFHCFKSAVIENLRIPLEERFIRLTRAHGSTTYPADFLLVAATNPCSCGYFGSAYKECECTPYSRQHYQKRISGPLLDRIDLQIQVDTVKANALTKPQKRELRSIQEKVNQAQKIQATSLKIYSKTRNNQLTNKEILERSKLTKDAEKLLVSAAQNLHFSARGFYKVMKVAQTIADLDQEKNIHHHHMAEALQYRPRT